MGPIRGLKICRQSEGHWEEEFVEGEDPRGQKFYWLTGNFTSRDTGPGTDINALREGYISIVPSSHDLTHHLAIPNLKSLEEVNPIHEFIFQTRFCLDRISHRDHTSGSGVCLTLFIVFLPGFNWRIQRYRFCRRFSNPHLGLIAICSNLILMQTFRKSYRNETIRGILIGSMILVIIWFFKFGIKILHL
jgi:hypothetical protein